jgi:hypothetical protein
MMQNKEKELMRVDVSGHFDSPGKQCPSINLSFHPPHQNKPTAPIAYVNKQGKKIEVDKDSTETYQVSLTLAELAIIQTLVNRSYFNCNCNLDKEVVQGVVVKVRNVLNGK